MDEVSTQTVALLSDALELRGLRPERLWAELGVTEAQLRPGGRIAWETWVAMIARVEDAFGPELERLFVPGAGARTGHAFVRVATAIVSVRDLFALFARWGLRRNMMTVSARFEAHGDVDARFTIAIDRDRLGSLPTLRFIGGVLHSLPTLQDLPPARVRLADATEHQAEYRLELPRERSRLARARRLLRLAGGASAALDELEQQASEIASKNAALEQQLAEIARVHAGLAERDEWLRLALDAGRIGIWRWSAADRHVRLSDELARLIGLPGQTDLAPSALLSRIHPADRDHLRDVALAAMARRGSFELECRVVREDGPLAWVLIKGTAAPGEDVHVVGTVADVSERKLLDGRLRFADRLIAAGTLAAGVAHEINNPLGYALGNLELVRLRLQRAEAADPEVDEMLGEVADGLARIRAVVTDLRAFARPEEDVVSRVAPQTACAAAIRIVSSMVRHRAALVTSFAPDTPAVMANSSRLGQVVINLVLNATDALPERPPAENRIVVRTRRLPTGEAAIDVVDNGAGIAPELLPRLFDPFFTTKPAGVGTGLGLSVCQRIVSSLQGRIDVTSEPGHGATFSIVLPAAPAEEPTAPAAPAAPTAPTAREDERTREPATSPAPAATTAAPRRRVLLIDDEPVLRRMLTTMLTLEGYEVIEAEGGREGLARALAEELDAVICDLMMPDLDGVDVHAELARRRPELLSRLVFVSGGAVSQRARSFAARPDIVMLTKPFSLAQLVEALTALPRA